VIVHNKTLAAQLADEFRRFFPNNAVHYFVSYYDYYQPEAYIPHTDTYIEKDSSINDEIDRLRHAATHALLTRSDVLIVASVSCIYGIGSPEFYQTETVTFEVGTDIVRDFFQTKLNNMQYARNDTELKRGTYRLKGDTLEIFPAYANNTFKIEFFGNTVEKIIETDWVTGRQVKGYDSIEIYPAKHFITPKNIQEMAVNNMKNDLELEVNNFRKQGKVLQAERLLQRTNFDIEMIEETGFCSGIENYSRYFDQRRPGEPATTLIDYFPKDFALFIDESHATIPQINGMFGGDRSRKEKLIEYGFRLKAAFDNRPLRFEEFYQKIDQVIFVSATPADYEKNKSTDDNFIYSPDHNISKDTSSAKPTIGTRQPYDAIVKQFIRPTGLLDPIIDVRATKGQIDDLLREITTTVQNGQRVLVTTLTKRMAEELTEYLKEKGVKVMYLHSDIDTLERSEILHNLRLGKFDVLVGINLLREGLDLPEVSLVAILDADKEGFLRSKTSLIQTMGRAARHVEGRVIMYADRITDSMKAAIDETTERRKMQEEYNIKNNIKPLSIDKDISALPEKEEKEMLEIDLSFKKMPKAEKRRVITDLRKRMLEASNNLEFERAAELRDQIVTLELMI
ncbi:MAG: excinuclease ABC subunit UvrB, partial [bacterium]